MKRALDLSESEIIAAVNEKFGCNFNELEFLPAGESSWVYIVVDETGRKSVLKILKLPEVSTVEVLESLSNRSFRWMPQFKKSIQGNLWEEIGGLYFSIQEFIHADTLHNTLDTPSNKDLHQLGVVLYELHSLRLEQSELLHVTRESFDSPLINMAHSAVREVVKQMNPSSAIESVRDCLIAQKGSIDQLFINIKEYGSELSKATNDLVLTHGDVHSGNILQSSNGLYLVDWDEAMLSLPEMDFKYFNDEQLSVISQGYGRDLLKSRLQIQYYRNLQMIRALWFWPTKLLSTEGKEQQLTAMTTLELFDSSPHLRRALEKF